MAVSLSARPERIDGKMTPYGAFAQQRRDARKRQIYFDFSLKEWITWWEENLGPDWFEKRGAKRGQYVMARLGDFGPYQRNNVECITAEQNHKDGNLGKLRPHSPEHCLAISLAKRGKPSKKKGMPMSEEQKDKLRGLKRSEETKRKLSIAKTGKKRRPVTQAQRDVCSAAAYKRWAKRHSQEV